MSNCLECLNFGMFARLFVRLVGLSIVSEEIKFVVTVKDYGTCWFDCNKLVVLKSTGVVTTWKLKHL